MTGPKTMDRRTMLRFSFASCAAAFFPLGISENPQHLIKKSIPASGERLTAIGMGTWQTFDVGGNQTARAVRREVLKRFADKGGELVDSSPMYGSSEFVVGDLASDLGLLDRLFIATKVWTTGREAGIRQMEQSLQRMQREPMDLLQVHNLVDFKTHFATLRDWKAAGKVRYIGVTHYLDNMHDELARVIETTPIDFLQVNLSIQSRNAEQRLLPLAQDKGVAVIINRPFEGGALFSRIGSKELPPWAEDYDIRYWSQFFLKYIISHPAVTCTIPATTNPEHMSENMDAAYGRLPDSEMREQMVRWWEEKG